MSGTEQKRGRKPLFGRAMTRQELRERERWVRRERGAAAAEAAGKVFILGKRGPYARPPEIAARLKRAAQRRAETKLRDQLYYAAR